MNASLARLSALAAVLVALLVSCPTDPPPKQNHPPVAGFTSRLTVQAMTALAFDGAASGDPDGDALIHTWEFGDGTRGGSNTVAHVFMTAGSFDVRLTVTDPSGSSNSVAKTITVSSRTVAAGASVSVAGTVLDVSGAVLSGAKVELVGGAVAGSSDAAGKVALELPTNVSHSLRISKSGYAEQYRVLELPGSAASGFFEARLTPRGASQTLDASAGGSLSGTDGARLTLPAGSLVNAAGKAVTGAAQVSLTPIDVTDSAKVTGFPGAFAGITASGVSSPIVSFGTTEFALSQGDARLQLAPGKSATIELPIYAALNLDGSPVKVGDSQPLWSLDERSGQWVQEGSGVVVTSSSSPSGLALRGVVAHFSWWNGDIGFPPSFPKPRCGPDPTIPGAGSYFANETICNMIGEMDRGLGRNLSGGNSSGGVVRPQADPPRLPGYRASITIPIGGGQSLLIPAGNNVILRGCALGGTWCGQVTVNKAVDSSDEVFIALRPLVTGSDDEAITPPTDLSRAVKNGQVSRFNFTASANQWLQVTASTLSSGFVGTVRLLRGGVELVRSTFNPQSGGSIEQKLLDAGQYTIEVTGTVGAYRLQAKLIDVVNVDKLVSVSLKDGESTAYSFTGFAGMVVHFYSTQADGGGGYGQLSLTDPDGFTKSIDGAVLGVTRQLTKNGIYTVSLRSVGSAGKYLLTSSLVVTPSTPLTFTSRSDVSDTLGRLGATRFYDLALGAGDFTKLLLKVPDTLAGTLSVGYGFGPQGTSQSLADFNGLNSNELFNHASGLYRVRHFAVNPATVAGRYLLKLDSRCLPDCAGYANSSFPYSFTVLRPNPVQLVVDTPVSSAFTEPYGLEVFKLNVTDPGYYLVYFRPTAPKLPLEGEQDLFLDAYAPDLTNEGYAYRGLSELTVNLTAGTHTLRIDKRYAEAAPYNLTAIRLAPPTPLNVPSGLVSGNIDLAAQKRYYSFSRNANQTIKISFTASSGWSGYVRIYKQLTTNGEYTNAANTLAAQTFGAAYGNPQSVSFTFTPPADGTYIVRVNGVDASGNPQTGNYTLSLETP